MSALDSLSGFSPEEREIYESAMSDGDVDVERVTINVMGRDRVGKTCFADSLADKPFCEDQPSSDRVTVRTMITSTDGWAQGHESDTDHHLDKTLARGIVSHEQLQATTRSSELQEDFTEPLGDPPNLHDPVLDIPQVMEVDQSVVPPAGHPSFGGSLFEDRTSREIERGLFTSDPDEPEISQCRDELSRQLALEEAKISALVGKFRNDPDLVQHETSLRVVKVCDFPGQPLVWTMLSGILQINPSPYNVIICMLLFNIMHPLSGPAQQPVFFDEKHGLLRQETPHWIEHEGDYIRYLLMMMHISQADPLTMNTLVK